MAMPDRFDVTVRLLPLVLGASGLESVDEDL